MKKYVLTVIANEDDRHVVSLKSDNDGFSSFELLGILQQKVIDVSNQISGSIVPKIEYDRTAHAEKTEDSK